MSPLTDTLAVCIPAYKPEHLGAALESLAGQTDTAFRVYIGDDASPHNLSRIAAAFRGRLDLRFHRFSENAGRQDLVAQWNRTIRLSTESWVWLFSDDDVADPGCVAAWRAAVAQGPAIEVLRFQTRTVDGEGREIRLNEPHPEWESAAAFVLARLRRGRRSYACEYVFSRRSFDALGGLVSFPLAWCSDDASWAALAGPVGIRTLPGPVVSWRYGGGNLSTPSRGHRAAKREALLRYLEWLAPRLDTTLGASHEEAAAIRAAMGPWFWHQLHVADALIGQAERDRLARLCGAPIGSAELLRHNLTRLLRRMKERLRP